MPRGTLHPSEFVTQQKLIQTPEPPTTHLAPFGLGRGVTASSQSPDLTSFRSLPPVRRTEVDPFGEDCQQTAAGHAHAAQSAADLRIISCKSNWPKAIDPHPPSSPAESRQTGSAGLEQASGSQTAPPNRPGHGPFPSGYILQGRHIDRSDRGAPAISLPRQPPKMGTAKPQAQSDTEQAATATARRIRHHSRPNRRGTLTRRC